MDIPEILSEVDKLDKESKALEFDLAKICWYMRGGVSLDEAYSMSLDQRMIVSEIVKENLETTKKTGIPFF
jgi:hypothetical protein